MFEKYEATLPVNSFDVYACQVPKSTQRVRFTMSKEERFNQKDYKKCGTTTWLWETDPL